MDSVTGAEIPFDTGIGGHRAATLAFRRAVKVYNRLPPWMKVSAPTFWANRPDDPANPNVAHTSWRPDSPGHPRIALGVNMTRDMADARGTPSQKRAEYDFIHEVGHTLGLGEAQTETIARHLSRRLLDYVPYQPNYEPEVEALAQRHPNTVPFLRKQMAQRPPAKGAGVLTRYSPRKKAN